MALSNEVLFEQQFELDQAKPRQTSLPTLPNESQAGLSQQWMLPSLPQECLLYQPDGESKTKKRPLTPALENVLSPFRTQVALDSLKKGPKKPTIEQPEFSPSRTSPLLRIPLSSVPDSQSRSTPLDFPVLCQNSPINTISVFSGPSSQPYTGTRQPEIPTISTPSAADPKGKLPAHPVSEAPILPTAPLVGHSNEATTQWRTWRERIPREIEIHSPEVQQPVASRPASRRGRGAAGGRPRPRRCALRTKSVASSIPEPPPIPVPYRRIQNAQGKPIFRKAGHDREGLAGMIGVTREEWDLGLRTPVYAPPSDWMRLWVLQTESEMARKYAWVKEIEGYLARRFEEVELARSVHVDIMKMGWAAFNERWREEELMGVPILDGPAFKKTGGGVGLKSDNEATPKSIEAVSPYSEETSQISSDNMDSQRMEVVQGLEGESSDGTANSTSPDLGGKDEKDVNGGEGLDGIEGSAEPILTTTEGVAVGRSDGTAGAPICVDSSSAEEDGSDENEDNGESFMV
ncbi:hypothetical protein VE03_10791 [Pseudogymnoascus sp. 23342-1-I1]|nr:hypothetical protein VE03_10791 [Pseudogymnoascus sp. 23342-1-I1]